MSIKDLSQTPAFKDFMALIEEEKALNIKALTSQDDVADMHRSQGAIAILDWVLGLPEQIDSLDKMEDAE